MTSRLQLYNNALVRHLGERPLASLTENNRARRALDTVWDADAVNHCLEAGYWNFAIRTVFLTASTDIEPSFGYRYAFVKPDDYVKTYKFCTDEFFQNDLREHTDEKDHWFCNYNEVYVQYISNGSEYGTNYGAWTPSFERYVELYLAASVAEALTKDTNKAVKVEQMLSRALSNALGKDAANQPSITPKHGGWASARLNGNRTPRWRGQYDG